MGNRATDPRDKVFVLFGIANEAHDITLAHPDYSRTVEEVYTSLARLLVGDDHSLQILSAVQHGYTRSSLPSWVPDWRIEWPIRVHGERRTYPIVTHLPHPHKLALGGFAFDIVHKVDNAELRLDVVNEFDRTLFHSLHDRCTIANRIGYDGLYLPTQEDIEVAWLRTISAGLFPAGTQLETFFARAGTRSTDAGSQHTTSQ